MSGRSFGASSPKSFNAYPRGEFDIESLSFRNPRKLRSSELKFARMLKSAANRFKYFYKLHPVMVFCLSLLFGVMVLCIISFYEGRLRLLGSYTNFNAPPRSYPLARLKNLVMVAGHSVYTSNSCGKVDNENSWYLETYQKHPGQAATFVSHIKKGVEAAAKDYEALLLFSGGETRKDAGPRSEAQSYWLVADSEGWFGEFILLLDCYCILHLHLKY